MEKIVLYSPWQIKDGIYAYTRSLREALSKSKLKTTVVPYENAKISPSYLTQKAKEINNQSKLVHIQHEFSFYGDWRNPFNKLFANFLKDLKIKKVITVHSYHPFLVHLDPNNPHPPFRNIKKFIRSLIISNPWAKYTFAKVFNESDKVLVHSEFHKRHLVKYGVSLDKIQVIPMGVEKVTRQKKRPDQIMNISLQGKKVITILGFIDPAKGYDIAVEAMTYFPENYILLLAGGARTPKQIVFQELLWKEITKLGLNDRVFQTGYLTDEEIGLVMAATDIQLVPQKYVASSQSLQTGLGYGKAIVASDLPYAKDMQRRLACLALFTAGDTKDLVRTVLKLIKEPKKKILLEKQASLYAEKYSWENIALIHKEIYEDLLRN